MTTKEWFEDVLDLLAEGSREERVRAIERLSAVLSEMTEKIETLEKEMMK